MAESPELPEMQPAEAPAPVTIQPAPTRPETISAELFEADAFRILSSAASFEDGMNELSKAYQGDPWDDPARAQEILSEYGEALRGKFERKLYGEGDLDLINPIKLEDIPVSDTITDAKRAALDRINNHEKTSLEYWETTTDPDQVASKTSVINSIKRNASENRRMIQGGDAGIVRDHVNRVLGGALDWAGADFSESTNPEYDASISGAFASGIGQVGALITAGIGGTIVGGPAGGIGASTAVGTAMGTSQVSDQYNKILEETANPEGARSAAEIEALSQTLQMLPTGKAAGKLATTITERVAGKVLKETSESAARKILTAGAVEAVTEWTGQVASNFGTNVGLSRESDFDNLTEGAGTSALVGGVLGSAVEGLDVGLSEFDKEKFRNARTLVLTKLSMDGKAPTKADTTSSQKDTNFPPNSIDDFFSKVQERYSNPVSGSGVSLEPQASRIQAATVQKSVEENVFNARPKVDSVEVQALNEEGQAVPRTESLEPSAKEAMEGAAKVTSEEVKTEIAPEDLGDVEDVDINKVLNDATNTESDELILGADIQTINNHITGAPNDTGVRLAMSLMRSLGGTTKGVAAAPGQYGNYNRGTNVVSFVRALARDPNRFIKTISHEIGHFIDYLAPKSNLAQKLVRTKQQLRLKAMEVPEIEQMARDVSKAWRPGWEEDGSANDKYRSKPEEVYADVLSAVIVRPDLFINPNGALPPFQKLYSILDQGFSSDPQLSAFWNTLKQMTIDPSLMDAFDIQQDLNNRSSQTETVAKEAAEEQAVARGQLNKAPLKAWLYGVDSFHSARKLAMEETDLELRDEKLKILNDMEDPSYFRMWLDNLLMAPIRSGLERLEASKIKINDLEDYLRAQNVLSGTTRTMENIKADPGKYFEILEHFGDKGVLEKYIVTPETRSQIEIALSDPDNIDVELLTRALSLVGLDFALAEANISKRDKARLREAKGKDKEKIQRRINAKSAARAERDGVTDAQLRLEEEYAKGNQDVPAEIIEILSPTAFNTRKFVANDYGGEARAKRDMARLERDLGPTGFKILQAVDKQVHQAWSSGFDMLEESGIYPKSVMDRLRLNKDSYATTTVLKYFEGNNSISPMIKTAVGSLNPTGGALADTTLKMGAIYSYAFRQNGANNYVNFMKGSGVEVSNAADSGIEIDPKQIPQWNALKENRAKDVWAVKTYENGKETVWIVKGRELSYPLKNISDVPVLNTVAKVLNFVTDTIESFNNVTLTRPLFTVLNTTFAIKQFRMDRKIEARYAGGMAPWLGSIFGFHLTPQLLKLQVKAARIVYKLMRGQSLDENDAKLAEEVVSENVINKREIQDQTPGLQTAEEDTDRMRELLSVEAGKDTKIGRRESRTQAFARRAVDAIESIPYLGAIPRTTRSFAMFGEQMTKMMGYMIARERLGMPPAAAVAFAKQNFGTPTGGGLLKKETNAAFLFGRAGFLGWRNFTRIYDARKGKLNVAGHITRNIILPKLMVMNAVIVPIVASMFGDEEAKKREIANNMIPTWDKYNTNPHVLGFVDGGGNFLSMDAVRLSDIKSDWKVWYFREPMVREDAMLSGVILPLFEDFIKGKNAGEIASSAASNTWQQFSMTRAPLLQYFTNLWAIANEQNPFDPFRRKEIFTEKEWKDRTMFERMGNYMKDYLLPNQLKSVIGYDPFRTDSSTPNDYDKILKAPVVGPIVKSFMGVSNYGLVEQGKAVTEETARMKQDVVSGAGEATLALVDLASKADRAAQSKQTLPKDISKEEKEANARARSFRSTTYRFSVNEAMRAYERGDTEEYLRIMKKLEVDAGKIMGLIEKAQEKAQLRASK